MSLSEELHIENHQRFIATFVLNAVLLHVYLLLFIFKLKMTQI